MDISSFASKQLSTLANLAGAHPTVARIQLERAWDKADPDVNNAIKVIDEAKSMWPFDTFIYIEKNQEERRTPGFVRQIRQHLRHAPQEKEAFLKLGIINNAESDTPIPPTARNIFINSTLAVLELIVRKKIDLTDAILPGLGFKDASGNIIYVNPCVSGWPDSTKWTLIEELPQIEHDSWAESIGENGIQPTSLAQFFRNHDFIGHFSELIAYPEIMRWTKRHQIHFVELKNSMRTIYGPQSNMHKEFLAMWDQYFLRNFHFAEMMAIPKLIADKEILDQILGKSVLGKIRAKNLKQSRDEISQMDDKQVIHLGLNIGSFYPDVLQLHGGALRDHNRINLAHSHVAEHIFNLISKTKFTLSSIYGNENSFAPSNMLETLYGIGLQIETLYTILFRNKSIDSTSWEGKRMKMSVDLLTSDPNSQVHAISLLRDLIARFRAGLSTGLSLKITNDQIIRDSMPWVMNRTSSTFIFLSSFSPPGTSIYSSFLKTSAFENLPTAKPPPPKEPSFFDRLQKFLQTH